MWLMWRGPCRLCRLKKGQGQKRELMTLAWRKAGGLPGIVRVCRMRQYDGGNDVAVGRTATERFVRLAVNRGFT